jgi:hypothetical protein
MNNPIFQQLPAPVNSAKRLYALADAHLTLACKQLHSYLQPLLLPFFTALRRQLQQQLLHCIIWDVTSHSTPVLLKLLYDSGNIYVWYLAKLLHPLLHQAATATIA